MEQKKTIFDYLGQLFATYGIIVAIFIVIVSILGENAQTISSLFGLGAQGLTVKTLAQLLALTGIITFAQVAFLTDELIETMNIGLRYILFFSTICIAIGAFTVIFAWFPINNIKSWVAFAVSFAACVIIGAITSKAKENAENKKMEQALNKIRKEK